MYWYDFGRNDVYVGNGGKFKKSDCKRVSEEEKEKIASFFADHVLKIFYDDEWGYDSSDDDRAGEASYSNSSYVYRKVNTEQDLYGVIYKDGEIKGVAFYVKDNSRNVTVAVFNFNGVPKTTMRLGYSASHSSSFTYVKRVMCVKKGENGVPTNVDNEANFIQAEMYPSI